MSAVWFMASRSSLNLLTKTTGVIPDHVHVVSQLVLVLTTMDKQSTRDYRTRTKKGQIR